MLTCIAAGELRRICESDEAWDKKTCELALTEVGETSMTLRASISSASAAENFALRCRVRENLVIFLRQLDGGVHLTRAPAA